MVVLVSLVRLMPIAASAAAALLHERPLTLLDPALDFLHLDRVVENALQRLLLREAHGHERVVVHLVELFVPARRQIILADGQKVGSGKVRDLLDIRLLWLNLDRLAKQVLLLLGGRHIVQKLDALLLLDSALAAALPTLALQLLQFHDLPLLLPLFLPLLELALLLCLCLLRLPHRLLIGEISHMPGLLGEEGERHRGRPGSRARQRGCGACCCKGSTRTTKNVNKEQGGRASPLGVPPTLCLAGSVESVL